MTGIAIDHTDRSTHPATSTAIKGDAINTKGPSNDEGGLPTGSKILKQENSVPPENNSWMSDYHMDWMTMSDPPLSSPSEQQGARTIATDSEQFIDADESDGDFTISKVTIATDSKLSVPLAEESVLPEWYKSKAGAVAKPSTASDDQDVCQIRNEDVPTSRGGGTIQHPGHQFFIRLVEKRRKAYKDTIFHSEKNLLVEEIMTIIQDRGGRFMKKQQDGQYVELSKHETILKVKQALRTHAHLVMTPAQRKEALQERKKEPKATSPSTVRQKKKKKAGTNPTKRTKNFAKTLPIKLLAGQEIDDKKSWRGPPPGTLPAEQKVSNKKLPPKKKIAQKASSEASIKASPGTTATSKNDSHVTTTVKSVQATHAKEGVRTVTVMDVVAIGRGVYSNNCIYQSLIDSNRSVYQLVSPELKPGLSSVIVQSVQETGGHFLRLGWDNLYYEMSHAEAMAVTEIFLCRP